MMVPPDLPEMMKPRRASLQNLSLHTVLASLIKFDQKQWHLIFIARARFWAPSLRICGCGQIN